MKVCVAGELAGGVGVYTQNLMKGLQELGHDVTCVTPQADASTVPHTVPVAMVEGRGRFPRQALHLARGVAAVAAGHDVVHITDARYAALMGDVAQGTPLVGTMNDDFYCSTRWLSTRVTRGIYEDWRARHLYYNVLRIGEGRALRHFSRVICISGEVRNSLHRYHGVPIECLPVVHYGIDFPEPEPVPQAATEGSGRTVLFAGGNFQRKGLDVLIDAAPTVITAVPDTKFIVVGSSQDERRMKERANSLGLGGHFEFMGQIPLERLHSLYQQCSVFAMPSKRESFGIPYLEAMHHGAPVVASDALGPSDYLHDGVNALCPPAGEIAPLAEAVIAALTNEELRSQLVAEGRKTVSEFSPRKMAADTAAVYADAVGERHK